MLRRALGETEPILKGVAASTPLGRLGRPPTWPRSWSGCVRDRSGYVTGLAVPVDGGLVEGHGALHRE